MPIALLLSTCATSPDHLGNLPSFQGRSVDLQGAEVNANYYSSPRLAEKAFGFDPYRYGLVPVRFVLDNRSPNALKINPQQTFLIDHEGQAWPVLAAEQAYKRIGKSGGNSQTAVGFALEVLKVADLSEASKMHGGENALERKTQGDLTTKSLRNQTIQPGEMAYGMIFFPGKEEAKSIKSLKFSVESNGRSHMVDLTLSGYP